MTEPYAHAAALYLDAGWTGVLPVVGKANGLPPGRTGVKGIDPDQWQMSLWVEQRPNDNIALRMPEGVIGIDVDDYGDKTGGSTMRKAVERWGNLPSTWRSTSRADDGISGIYFYRVAPGTELAGVIDMDGERDVELIQRHHRYAVAWPSIHPDHGGTYRWYTPDGVRSMASVPQVAELAWLPRTWTEGLTSTSVRLEEGERVDVERQHGEWGADVQSQLQRVIDAAQSHDAGSRHDAMIAATGALARLERRQFTGASSAIEHAIEAWVVGIGDERAGKGGDARREIVDAINGAREKVARTPNLGAPEGVDPMAWAEIPVASQETLTEEPGGRLVDRLLSAGDVLELPEPDPLVHGLVDKGMTVEIVAKWGEGKTFVALSMGWSLAAGIDWLGHPTEQTNVLYVAAEGLYTVAPRERAWLSEHELQPSDIEGRWWAYGQRLSLLDVDDVAGVIEAIGELGIGFVVFDTLNRSMPGADENDPAAMGAAFESMDEIRRTTGATVVVVHHAGHGDKQRGRGHSSMESNLDIVLLVEKTGEQMSVKSLKQKARGTDHEPVRATLEVNDEGPVLTPRQDDLMATADQGRGLDDTTHDVWRMIERYGEVETANMWKTGSAFFVTTRRGVNDAIAELSQQRMIDLSEDGKTVEAKNREPL